MLADAVDVVKSRQQRSKYVDDAVLTEAILLLLRTIAEVDEFRTLTLESLKIFRGFLLGLAQWGQGVVGSGVFGVCSGGGTLSLCRL